MAQNNKFLGMTTGELMIAGFAFIMGGCEGYCEYKRYSEWANRPPVVTPQLLPPLPEESAAPLFIERKKDGLNYWQYTYPAAALGELSATDTIVTEAPVAYEDQPVEQINNYYYLGKQNGAYLHLEQKMTRISPVSKIFQREDKLQQSNLIIPNSARDLFYQELHVVIGLNGQRDLITQNDKRFIVDAEKVVLQNTTEPVLSDKKEFLNSYAEQANFSGHVRNLLDKYRNNEIDTLTGKRVFRERIKPLPLTAAPMRYPNWD